MISRYGNFDLWNRHRIFCFLHLNFDINYLYLYMWMSEGCWCADSLFILTYVLFIFYFYSSTHVFNRQFFTFLSLLPSFCFDFVLLFKYYSAFAISFLFSYWVINSIYFFILFRYRFWTLQLMSWISCEFFSQDFDNVLGKWNILFFILESSRS